VRPSNRAMPRSVKSEYVLRRQALEEELARAAPPFDPRLDKAEELLADFGRVWEIEDDPAKRRRLLAALFDRVWAGRRHDRHSEAAGSVPALLRDSRRIGSSPRKEARCQERERRDSNPSFTPRSGDGSARRRRDCRRRRNLRVEKNIDIHDRRPPREGRLLWRAADPSRERCRSLTLAIRAFTSPTDV